MPELPETLARRFNIYGRFQVELRREAGHWVAYRSEPGKRTRLHDIVVPAELTADELASYLDDLFHEYASVGARIDVLPDQ